MSKIVESRQHRRWTKSVFGEEGHVPTLSVVGAAVYIVFKSGAKVFADVLQKAAADEAGAFRAQVVPWGCRHPMSIALSDVAVVASAEVDQYAKFRRICEKQRAELEGPPSAKGGTDDHE